VVTGLLVGLRDRGLEVTRPILVVIDGAKALRRAVGDVFDHPVIQRCQLHKLRNVTDRLPDAVASAVAKRMRAAYHNPDPLLAQADLEALARELHRAHPGAAASLREGLAETLTIIRLGVPPTLARTLRSTNSVWVFGLLVRIALPEREPPVIGGCALTLNSIGAPPGCLRTRGVGPRHRARGGWRPGLKGAWALNPDLPARGLLVSRPVPSVEATGGWRAGRRRGGGDRRAQAGVQRGGPGWTRRAVRGGVVCHLTGRLTEAVALLDSFEFAIRRVGVEGSAGLGRHVTQALVAAGYDVREVQANRTAERRRRRRRHKTDRRTPRRSPARPWPTRTCRRRASSAVPTRPGRSWSPFATGARA
jgi:hypothetical protein